MLDFLIFAVCVIIFLIISVIYLYPGSKKVTTIPGPQPVDTLEGNFPDIKACGSFHEFLADLHGHYGDIVAFWWGPQLAVSIASPELFRQHSKPFDRPPEFFELFRPLIGENCIQYANGEDGRRRHAAYSRCYTTDAVDQYYSIFTQLSKEFLKKWNSCADKEEHIALREYMFAFGIKSMLRASYGRFFDSDKKIMGVRAAYDYCWAEMDDRLRGEGYAENLDMFEKQKDVLYGLMKQAMEHRKDHPPPAGEHLVIDGILDLSLSEATTVQDMVVVLVAGFHTTGLLLTWAFYFLASHPDAQQKAYEEICVVLEGEEVTGRSAPHLPYLRQVLDETLRCSVMAPYAARVQDFDTELGGHRVPAGTPVVHALGVALQDPKFYPDPEKFDPERFSEEISKDRPPCSFEPFGFAGKRKCPGWRFSLAEAMVVITAVLKRFEVKMVPDQVVTPVYGLVTTPKEEIWITLEKRK